MNSSSPDNHPATEGQTAMSEFLGQKSWVDSLAWYCLVMGFIGILTGGLFFWLYRQGSLRHADYVLNGNALGRYFLIAGIAVYMIGRGLSHYQRLRRRRR